MNGILPLLFCFPFLDDSDISRLAERLVEIVDHSRFPSGKKSIPVMERALSLEEDGGSTSKPIPPPAIDGLGKVFFLHGDISWY